MSRYVHLDLPVEDRAELTRALDALGVPYTTAGAEGLLLDGSLECAGEPVDVRIAPEVFGTIQDWGLRRAARTIEVVCGDTDRRHLTQTVLPRILAQVTAARLEAAGHRTRHVVDADGTHRLVVGVTPGDDDGA